MKFNITCDAHWESKLDKVLNDLYSTGFWRQFEDRSYGKGLVEIFIILMCRDPLLNFKRRIRFVKKEKILYMDIMLDLDQMRRAEDKVRRNIVLERLADEVPSTLNKYVFSDFNVEQFVRDLKHWAQENRMN